MSQLTMTKRVAAPTQTVFEVFSDIPGSADTVQGITKIEMLSGGPVGVGTRWKETRVFMKREATEELFITAFDPGKSYSVGCEACGCRYDYTFRFEPDGDGTSVVMEMEHSPLTLLAKLMAPLGKLMMGSMKKCIDQDLEDLKAVAEGKTAPSPATR